jgi:hypothetical protein
MKVSNEQREHWRGLWRMARLNMPTTKRFKTGLLYDLLGYPCRDASGKTYAWQRYRHSLSMGTIPSTEERRDLLMAFASENGRAIAKAIAVKRGVEIK